MSDAINALRTLAKAFPPKKKKANDRDSDGNQEETTPAKPLDGGTQFSARKLGDASKDVKPKGDTSDGQRLKEGGDDEGEKDTYFVAGDAGDGEEGGEVEADEADADVEAEAGEDAAKENPFAEEGDEEDEDGDVDLDGIPDDEDDDTDGNGVDDEHQDLDLNGVADSDENPGAPGQGGAVQQIVAQLADAEKEFYAAKGLHGAGHHQAEAAMSAFHKLVRKLVRTVGAPASPEADEGAPPLDANTFKSLSQLSEGARDVIAKSFGFEDWTEMPYEDLEEESVSVPGAEIGSSEVQSADMGEGAFIDWNRVFGKVIKTGDANGNPYMPGTPGDKMNRDANTPTDMFGANPYDNTNSTPATAGSTRNVPKPQMAPFIDWESVYGTKKPSTKTEVGTYEKMIAAAKPAPVASVVYEKSLSPIDALQSLFKGGEQSGHKYISRKPDGKGGYSYVYPDDKTLSPHEVSAVQAKAAEADHKARGALDKAKDHSQAGVDAARAGKMKEAADHYKSAAASFKEAAKHCDTAGYRSSANNSRIAAKKMEKEAKSAGEAAKTDRGSLYAVAEHTRAGTEHKLKVEQLSEAANAAALEGNRDLLANISRIASDKLKGRQGENSAEAHTLRTLAYHGAANKPELVNAKPVETGGADWSAIAKRANEGPKGKKAQADLADAESYARTTHAANQENSSRFGGSALDKISPAEISAAARHAKRTKDKDHTRTLGEHAYDKLVDHTSTLGAHATKHYLDAAHAFFGGKDGLSKPALAAHVDNKRRGRWAASENLKGPAPVLAQKSLTQFDGSGRALKKGFTAFIYDDSVTARPASMLYGYLCAAVEAAFEEQRAEPEHCNETDESLARIVYGQLTLAAGRNSDLRRACTILGIDDATGPARVYQIASVEGFLKTHADIENDTQRFAMVPMVGKSFAMQADHTSRPGLQILQKSVAQVELVDDKQDPYLVLQKGRIAQHTSRYSPRDESVKINYDSSCPVHRDLSKAHAIAHPYLRCTCPK